MGFLPKQVEADDEVLKYWLKKTRWSQDEFASLYCGINPFAWSDDKTYMLYGRKKQISDEKETEIKELLTLIDHRIDLHRSVSNTPANWKQILPELELAIPNWLLNDQTEQKINIEKVDVQEKPLTTTERNTLLTIIAALCDNSKIKYQERGAAAHIARLTQASGASVNEDTISKALKKIPIAIAARMK